MVDPTKGISSVTPVSGKPSGAQSGARAPQESEERREPSPDPVDSVEISPQALSLQDVEHSAALTRSLLETTDVSLGLDLKKLEEPA